MKVGVMMVSLAGSREEWGEVEEVDRVNVGE